MTEGLNSHSLNLYFIICLKQIFMICYFLYSFLSDEACSETSVLLNTSLSPKITSIKKNSSLEDNIYVQTNPNLSNISGNRD